MIDISNWIYCYKRVPGYDFLTTTNMLYTPMMNPEGNIMCMIWDENSDYQKDNPNLSKDLINFCFEREMKHLTLFQNYSWAPKLIDIDVSARKIFLEWNTETLNHIVFGGRDLNQLVPDWKDQVFNILKDISDSRVYKMALYPHCFFIDSNGKIKTFDFYSCVGMEERYIPRSTLSGMIGVNSGHRFDNATVEDKIDFKYFFKDTMLTHLSTVWKDNPFPDYYNLLFKDKE